MKSKHIQQVDFSNPNADKIISSSTVKSVEKKQIAGKDDIIGEIDFELSMIEDYAHGEVGNAITNLRNKIQQYYKTTYGK